MSLEDVEKVVRSIYERLNRTGEPTPSDYAPDATFDGSRVPGLGISQGLNQWLADWVPYRDTFDEWRIEVEESLVGPGDRVFAAIRDGGRLKGSGAELRQTAFHVWELHGGQVVGLTIYLNRAEALEAAGISE
jgi:hypothetical protein